MRKSINVEESVDKLRHDTLGLTFRKNEGEEVCDLFKTGFYSMKTFDPTQKK